MVHINNLVSCIIPSYKRTDTLKRAIESILNQTYINIEVLVVDDNVEGDKYSIILRKIVDSYKVDGRVFLVTQPKHINGAEARNAGVRAANGEYVAFLDDDDEWLPTKLEKQMSILETYQDFAGVAGGATLWEGNKEILNYESSQVTPDTLLLDVLLRKVGLATSTFLCKKSAFIEIGGFDTSLKRSQDLQLFADFLIRFKIFPIINECTTKMYIESNINRLDCKSAAQNKEDFFHSIADVLATFPISIQKRIKSAHYYEVALIAFREKKYGFCAKYVIKGLQSPISVLDLVNRIRNRYHH